MAKDEIAKQLEELKKYIAEQERLRGIQKSEPDTDEPGDEEFEDFNGDDPDEIFPPVFTAEPVNIMTKDANANPTEKKSGCGCGCFSFVVFMIILSFLLPIILNVVKRRSIVSYNKTVSVKTSSAIPAPNTSAAIPDPASYDEEEMMRVEVSYADNAEESAAEAAAGDDEIANAFAPLMQQKKTIDTALINYRKAEYKHRENLNAEAKRKRFSSFKEKEEYFTNYYNTIISDGKKHGAAEYEAARFYLNYSRLELGRQLISQELAKLNNLRTEKQ